MVQLATQCSGIDLTGALNAYRAVFGRDVNRFHWREARFHKQFHFTLIADELSGTAGFFGVSNAQCEV